MPNNDLDSLGFLYKTMIERDPKKRRVKPVESLIGALDLDDSEDDSDFNPNNVAEDDDDVDVDEDSSDDNNKTIDVEDEDSDDIQILSEDTIKTKSSPTKGSNKSKIRKSSIKSNDSLPAMSHRTLPRQYTPSILVCSVCLGDISRSDDEIVVCDSCGISVHEGCYGIVSDDTESLHSNTSSASTEPWFCDPCRANVRNPYCELCPNSGGIFKETDVGRWVHMVCALYTSGVTFKDVIKLTGLSLFEMPYSRWGYKACILCEDERLSRTGVSICCDAGMCKSYFHVTCAQREGLLSESHSVDDVDPFIAYCKLHADRSTQRGKRRNWLALQSRFRSDFNTITNQRIQLKLSKQRNKWKENRIASEGNVWVPTQKMPRLLNTSPSAIKRLIRKAELLGLSPQTHIVSHEVGDVRRKWHVPPAFSVEFISYYIDRNNRMTSMQKRSEELIAQNNQLKDTENTTRLSYEKSLHKFERIKEETDCLRIKVKNYFNVLNSLSEQNIPLPKILEVNETTKKSLTQNESNRKQSSLIKMNECGICHQTKDQHQLALCDSCQLYYHLYCLDPPLTRMPKKTRFGGWQCSDCTEQETQDSDNETSNQSAIHAPRKLREHVKGPNKFEPDAGYSPPSSVSSASKLLKRKLNLNSTKKKKKRQKIKDNKTDESSETSETLRKSVRRSPISHRKQINAEEMCFECNQTAIIRERVQCDDCDNYYHFNCLDPPVKKCPKQRGYTWYCHHCDLSDEENDDNEEGEEVDDEDDDEDIDEEENVSD